MEGWTEQTLKYVNNLRAPFARGKPPLGESVDVGAKSKRSGTAFNAAFESAGRVPAHAKTHFGLQLSPSGPSLPPCSPFQLLEEQFHLWTAEIRLKKRKGKRASAPEGPGVFHEERERNYTKMAFNSSPGGQSGGETIRRVCCNSAVLFLPHKW